jgi:orotidine-5'-phosphate decarboxylase
MTSGRDQLAFALDVTSLAQARALIASLSTEVGVFKVGLELFTAAGPDAVQAVHDAGCACFLDLKLHDIPATVARATAAAAELGVEYLTLHASAGATALSQAQAAVAGSKTRLLAITVLTSMSDADLTDLGFATTAADAMVARFAMLAQRAGVTGLVCSALEAATLRAMLGSTAFLVTPGIRQPGAAKGDQQRTLGPTEAITAGSDLLVVGRPIRDAADPLVAARNFRLAIAAAKPS